MKNSALCFPCLALAVLLSAGCKSTRIANRINEKASVFATLPPDQQIYVTDGIVFPGDTVEMAYIALGNPISVETKEKDGDKVEMWTYTKYYPSGELADFLTEYSLNRNPNLHRSLDHLQVGKETVNVNAPRSGGSLSDTDTGEGNPLSIADLPVYNLYVFFYEERVVDVKIESIDNTTFMWLEEAIVMEKANKLEEAGI
jgi:hypothetical protein